MTMKQTEHQKLLMTTNFMRVHRYGMVRLRTGRIIAVPICAIFRWDKYYFMIHLNGDVTECSTGAKAIQTFKTDPEKALVEAVTYFEHKKYYFSTSVGNILVKYQENLLSYNCALIDPCLFITYG